MATGVAAFGVFYAGGLVVREIPPLARFISNVLDYADAGDDKLVFLTTMANGFGEEVFFRGAIFAALGDSHPVTTSTGRLHAGHRADPQPRAGPRRRRRWEACGVCSARPPPGSRRPC